MGTTVAGTMFIIGSGKKILIPEQPIDSIDLNLNVGDGNYTWSIGIDQSTSCTGITLMERQERLCCMVDVHRDKNLPDFYFYKDLKNFLIKVVKGSAVDYIVYEKPIPNSKFRTAQNRLFELKGKLEDWICDIPEFNGAVTDSFFPQSWKSVVMDKTAEGKDRHKDKFEIATDVCKIYPEARAYRDAYPFTDFDSFDSLGILTGFFRLAFKTRVENGIVVNELDENGRLKPMIHGTCEKRHDAVVYIAKIENGETFYDSIARTFGEAINLDWVDQIEILEFNDKLSLSENARVATTMANAVITKLPPEQIKLLRWEFNLDDVEGLWALMMYKSRFSKSDYYYMDSLFGMRKDICGE